MARKPNPVEPRQEVFIQLRPDSQSVTAAIDRAIKAVEACGGRVVMGYPPRALVAELPESRMRKLKSQEDVELLQTGPFSETQVNAEISDLRFLMIAWNNRCATRHRKEAARFEGMSWDAPGMLPPDPPADVRKELRRREKEMKADDPEA